MKKRIVAHIKFNNGSHFKAFIMGKVPPLAKEANDFIYLEITPEKGRGEKDGYYMNIYDANNLIWVLTSAVLEAQELYISPLPKEEVKERKIDSLPSPEDSGERGGK